MHPVIITIENQDQFLHLHNSYLLVEDDVFKADNTRYADADLIALTNNGLMYLFPSLKVTLAGQMVEHVNYPGQATSLLGLATYSLDYSKGCGLKHGWTPDINDNAAAANTGFAIRQCFLIQSPEPKGSFQCAIPIKHVFSFMADYTKVANGMRDPLPLIREDDNDTLFRTAGKVVLSKHPWVAPIVQPNDVLKVNLYKSIAADNTIPVGFRRRQCERFTLPQARSTAWQLGVDSALKMPRCMLVGLQTDKSGNQERDAAIFDHGNLTSMQVCLNHFRYPTADMATDFDTDQYVGVYKCQVCVNSQRENVKCYVYVHSVFFKLRGFKMIVKFTVITPKCQILVKPTITKVDDHDSIYVFIISKNYEITNIVEVLT